jgi:hypothetical protein
MNNISNDKNSVNSSELKNFTGEENSGKTDSEKFEINPPTFADLTPEKRDTYLRKEREKLPTSVTVKESDNDRDIAIKLLKAFKPRNKSLFLFGDAMPFAVRAQYNGKNKAFFEPLTPDMLKTEFFKVLSVQKLVPDGRGYRLAIRKPPLDALKIVLTLDLLTAEMYFDYIQGVINYPIISKTGKIIDDYGFNAETAIFINSNLKFTRYSLTEAKNGLLEYFDQFPFKSETDKFNAISIIFTQICKQFFDVQPAFFIKAPKAGTGKSLLVSSLLAICEGEKPDPDGLPDEEDEIRKMILAKAMQGKQYVFFDNFDKQEGFNSAELNKTITSGKYSARILGVNKMASGKFFATFVFTGNNPQLKTEMTRRTIFIDLECKKEGIIYKHENLIKDIIDNREILLNYALSIIKDWWENGHNPYQGKKIDSFEQWTAIIGGIMQHIGANSFLSNVLEKQEEAEAREFGGAEAFLLDIYKTSQNKDGFKSIDLLDKAAEYEIINGEGSQKVQETALGIELRRLEGVNFNGLCIYKRGKHPRVRWFVKKF